MKETEQALIGSMVGDPSCIPSVMDIVSTGDFTDQKAGIAFKTIIEMFKQDVEVDPVTVGSREGVDFIYVAASTSVGFWTNADQYAESIALKAKLARMKHELMSIANEGSPGDILRGITDLYNAEAEGGKKTPEIESILERFDKHVEKNIARGSIGLNTGINALDDAMIYYVPGQTWAMGGYTSTGKTAMMVQMIVNVMRCNPGAKVCLISTEMTEEQMAARILGNISGIYSQRILAGDIFQADEEKYLSAYKELKSWNLKIHDDINELSAIESTARRHAMRGGMDVQFIDYVQNCCVKGVSEAYAVQRILATSIQQLAKTTDSTIVCLSQVSNSVGRGDVDTFELKGAGEWAAVADVGIMLKRGQLDERKLGFLAPKNRHGVKPDTMFKFSKNYSQLMETGESVPR